MHWCWRPIQLPTASYAGSLVCSLAGSQFDTYVEVRKDIPLQYTDWPVSEFVLWNWDQYSANDLRDILVGIYYTTGCQGPGGPISDGSREDAQDIADLFADWTGVNVPVVNLSNAAMRQGSKTPFSCQ